MNGVFFKGKVRFIGQGIFNAKYSIVDNGAIIKVKNSTHVRLFDQYEKWPDSFEIIAPLYAVSIKNGNIPADYLQHKNANEYLSLRMIYDGC